MGRPLKIAKAQAVLTITDTSTDGTVTVTNNLTTAPTVGVMAGMPFVVSSSVGGLTAGVTYYILAITGNNTFTVSSTQLSVQPQVSPALSDTTGQSVSATVAPVDVYFNNPVSGAGFPATNSNTYSIVGGNTAIVGPQVLANIAIGQNEVGTVFADTGSDIVAGYGTDFANLTTGTTLYALWGDGTGTPMLLGTASSTHGDLTVAVANTQNTGNIIGTTGNAQTLVEGAPVTFTANLGGLVTGTTYWVLNIANSSAFTVSLTPGGAEVDLSSATGTPDAVQQQVILDANSANNATGVNGTGDGYLTALHEAGYIVRQKGKQKYLVTGTVSGLTGPCYLANVANASLQPNTMSVLTTYANASTQNAQNLSDHNGLLFTATSGPVATGNIVLANATPVTLTFNAAAGANASNGQPFPIVTVDNA